MEGDPSSDKSQFIQHKILINPYYFCLLLLGFFCINFVQFFSLKREVGFSPLFFLTYALLQSFIEMIVLVLVADLVKRFFRKSIYYMFITFCFLGLIVHSVDFLLVRFMDASIFHTAQAVANETFENFIEILHVVGVSITTWIFAIFFILLSLPFCAILLYSLTQKLHQKKPLKLVQSHLVTLLICLPIALISIDLTATSCANSEDYHYYSRIFPWKNTLFSQKKEILAFDRPFTKNKKKLKNVQVPNLIAQEKPNIYLFVVESLREDFMTSDIAHHITDFREENISLGETFSNANATQLSWYSIFHSNYPFNWTSRSSEGSLPLQTLKKMGYDIHVYSGSELKYYKMDQSIFGKGHKLADSYHICSRNFPQEACHADKKAVNLFLGDLDQGWAKEGNVFVIFLDSTHFNYSWPEDYPLPFTPISEAPNHMRLINSMSQVELIKNRYRNAIHFVDSLFGTCIEKIKEKKLYSDSIILFTGDHGEEFLEEEQLFHATHLSRMQTHVPIYYKLGDNQKAKAHDLDKILTSHVDIFPTIFHYLTDSFSFSNHVQGDSILQKERFPFVFSARYDWGRNPSIFFIYNGYQKLTARFNQLKELEVISFKDIEGKIIEMTNFEEKEQKIRALYSPAFERLLE